MFQSLEDRKSDRITDRNKRPEKKGVLVAVMMVRPSRGGGGFGLLTQS